MTRSVGNYKLLQELGEGAMGTVYRALDLQLEREVAMKSLRSELAGRADIVERFQAEAKLQGRLESMHVVRLYQFLREGDEFFMVMEFVKGKTLGALLQEKGRLSAKDAIEIMLQALDGLGYAHKRKIVHRDVKPANIMISEDGVVKVADFGIARLVGSARQTKIGSIVGTLEYISPEAVQGREPTGVSDLYSSGIVLYELLTGHLPFTCTNEYELASAHVHTPPPPLRKWVSDIPKDLESAVLRAISKKPADRFQTAEQMMQALKRCLPAVAGPESRTETRVLRKFWSTSRADVPPPLPSPDHPPDGGRDTALSEGRSLLERGLPEQAKAVIEVALEKYPGDTALRELLRHAEADLTVFRARTTEVNRIAFTVNELQKEGRHQEAVAVALDAVATFSNQPEVTALLVRTVKTQKVETCRQEVEGLKKSEDWDGALATIDKVLTIYSREPLLLEMRKGVQQEREARRQEKEVDAVLANVAELQRDGRLEEAERAVSDAFSRVNNNPSLSQKLIDVGRGLKAARRKAMAEAAIAEARSQVKNREWQRAIDILNLAFREAPDETQLTEVRSEIEQDLDRYLTEVHRATEDCRKLLEDNRFEDAVAALSSACQNYPNQPGLIDLLAQAQQALSEDRRNRLLEQNLKQAGEFLAQDAFGEAEQFLLDAVSQFPGDPRLTDLLAAAVRGRREQEKRSFLEQALSRADQMAGEQRFADAISELDAVLAVHPAEPVVKQKKQELKESLREQHRVQRVTELREWSDLYAQDFDAALTAVQNALLEYPNDPDFNSISAEIVEGRRSFERAQAEKETAAQTAELESNDQYKEAYDLALAASAKYPDSKVLAGLPAAVLQRWEEAYKLRRAANAEGEIRLLLASGNPHAAVEPMETALAECPQHEGLLQLSQEVQAACRAFDAQVAAQMMHDAIAARQWDSAESAVQEFENNYGASAGASLRDEVSRAKRARLASIDDATVRVRGLLETKNFTEAISLIESLDLGEGEGEAFVPLLADARAGLANQAREKSFEDLRNRVSTALGRGDGTKVTSLIENARTEFENYPPFLELEESSRREIGIRAALDKGLDYVGARAWDPAIEHLESSARQFGADQRFSDLLTQVRQERQARHDTAGALLAESQALWDAGDYEQSVQKLIQAVADIPEDSALAAALEKARREWSSILEERERALLRANQAAQVEPLLEQARQLQKGNRFEDARKLLESSLVTFPNNPDLQSELLLVTSALQQTALAKAMDAAKTLQSHGRFVEATALLDAFSSAYKREPAVEELREAIEHAREASQRDGELRTLVRQVNELLSRGKAQEAMQILNSRPDGIKDRPEITELESRAQSQLGQQMERVTALEQALLSANGFREQNDLDQANQTLAAFIGKYGKDPQVAELELLIESDREELKRREKELNRLARRVEGYLAEGKARDATQLLESCPSYFQDHPEIVRLREQTAVEAEKQAEREAALQVVLSSALALEQQGRFEEAMAELDAFVGQHGPEARITERQKAIAGSREAARRAAEIRELSGRARKLLDEGKLPDLLLLLQGARSLVSQSDELRELRDTAEARLAAQKKGEAVASLLEEARPLLSGGDFTAALQVIDGGLKRFPASEELLSFRSEIVAAEAAKGFEEFRTQALARIRSLVAKQDYDGALRIWEDAQSKIPGDQQLAQAKVELDRQREAQTEQTIKDLLRRAQELLQTEPGESAAILQRLYEQYPGRPELAIRLARAREAELDFKERNLVKEAEQLAARGQFEQALIQLSQATRDTPELQAARRKFERQNAMVQIQALCEKGKYSKARTLHQQTVTRFGSDQGLEELLRRIESATETMALPPTERGLARRRPRNMWLWVLAGVGGAAILAVGLWLLARPAPAPKTVRIHLTVITDPVGATVRIGEQSCMSPNCSFDVVPGNYTIQAQKAGFQPLERKVAVATTTLIRSEKLMLQPMASPARSPQTPSTPQARTGTLIIQAGLPEALVMIDNVAVGRTDARGNLSLNLEPKTYSVRVQKLGYDAPAERRVTIARNLSLSAAFSLIGQEAKLELRGAPAGAEVRVDNAMLARTDGLPVFTLRVPPGDHTLRIGEGDVRTEVRRTFDPGATVTLEWSELEIK